MRYGCQPDLRKYTECHLSHIQYHPERTGKADKGLSQDHPFTAFITLPIMAGLFVTAGPVIRLLLKEEWWPSIPFFQLLCLGGCFTILTAINNNFIKVSGRSDGILKIEYYKIAFTVAVVLLTYREDVLTMVAGLVVTRLLVYIINMIYTAHYTGYRFSMQLMDLLPYAGLSILMTLLLLPIGGWIENQLLLLVTQAAAGTVIYIGTAYITGSKILKDSLELIRKKKDMNNNTGFKVSVLMLTYNQERYINEAIRSVMLQETNFPFELVIGNDASTDCTGTICADWQKVPGTNRPIQPEENLGLQQNFIQTYAQCRGQYIAICEGDDFWTDKRKLQIQADFLDTHPDYSTCFTGLSTTTKTAEPRASAMAGRSRIQTYQTLHAAITSPTYPLCSAGACSANCPNGLPVSAPTTMPYIC